MAIVPNPSEGFNLSPSGMGMPSFGGLNLNTAGMGSIAGGVSDLFSSMGYKKKAEGDALEQKNYQLAATFADTNEQYAAWSTGIKQSQQDRTLFKSLGETAADYAGAGLKESGNAVDVLRESAQQGAMAHAVLGEQGLITEAGYAEQAQSYRTMAQAAQVAIDADNQAAHAADITGAIKIATGVASMVAGGGGGGG